MINFFKRVKSNLLINSFILVIFLSITKFSQHNALTTFGHEENSRELVIAQIKAGEYCPCVRMNDELLIFEFRNEILKGSILKEEIIARSRIKVVSPDNPILHG